jgi:Uma2 family endonuclease
MTTARKLVPHGTFDDLADLPDDARLEIIAGEFVQKEPATFEHGDTQLAVGESLRLRFRRGGGDHPGWWFASEVLVELFPDELSIPDVAGWRRDRHPERPSGRPVRARPDWICEILSASTAHRDLGPKRAAYAAAGVEHYWIIDLEHRVSTVFRLGAEGYVIVHASGPDRAARVPPFAHEPIDVAQFFGLEPEDDPEPVPVPPGEST